MTKTLRYRRIIGATLACSFLTGPVAAYAQSADGAGGGLGDLVVTARKVEESVQDVPSSITVLSAARLEALGMDSVADIYRAAPNVDFVNSGFLFNSTLTIRGVRSSDSFAGFETGSGIVLDDVYIGRSSAFNVDLVEVERIEVLRGPQGTIQGKNIIGGAINIVTRKPGREFAGSVTVEAGSSDLFAARAYLNAPLTDTVAFNVSASHRRRDGFTRNAFTGNTLGDIDNYGGRAQLLWDAGAGATLLLAAEYSHDDATDGSTVFSAPGEIGDPHTPTVLARTVNADFDTSIKRKIFGVSAKAEYDLSDALTLTSVTGYRGYSIDLVSDQDGLPVPFVNTSVDQKQRQFSQELRLTYIDDGLTAIGGLYYYRETLRDNTRLFQNVPFLLGLPGPIPDFGIDSIDSEARSRLKTDSYAAFGSVTKDIGELTITGGLRITHDNRTNRASAVRYRGADGFVSVPALGQPFSTAPLTEIAAVVPNARGKLSSTELVGDLSATWHFNENVSTYAKYARGYKGGGFQSGLPTLPGSLGVEVKPEFVDNFELGFRSLLADRKLRLNVTGYLMNWKDRQATRLEIVSGVPTFVIFNDPKSRMKGIEVELEAEPVQGLRFGLSYGYTHAKFIRSADPTIDGNRFGLLSPNTLLAFYDTRIPLTDSIVLTSAGDIRYADGYVLSDTDGAPRQPSYWLANFNIGLEFDKRFSVTFWGRNLLDEDVVTTDARGVPSGGVAPFVQGPPRSAITLREPRTWGVRGTIRF